MINKFFNKCWNLIKSQHYLVVITEISILFLALYNNTFINKLFLLFDVRQDIPWAFRIFAPIAVITFLATCYTILFSYKYVLKISFIILFILSALASYAVDKYGIQFDTSMMQNFFETNVAEATSYYSISLLIYLVLLGIVPSVILFKLKITYPKSIVKSFLQRIIYIVVLLIFTTTIIISYYKEFSFIARENRDIQHQIVPVSYIGSTVNYFKKFYFSKKKPYVYLGLDAKVNSTTDKPKLYFIAVGETARAANQSALGYERNTNRYTSKEDVFNFHKVFSCGTATARSLPCMFSDLTRETYSDSDKDNRDSVFDVIAKAGVDVIWLENDGGCKGVCDRINNKTINPKEEDKDKCNGSTCFDSVFFKYANAIAKNTTDKDTVVVFHLIGSHGPKYYERYPNEFKIFTPDCNRADVENCSVQEVVNSYDNSILYTDYVIAEFIKILKQYEDTKDVALLYVSDHGESLGENGLYLHGAPYAFAPKEQIHIPMQLWIPEDTLQDLNVNRTCLLEYSKLTELSHDNIFHTLLGLTQVSSKEYLKDYDILKSCSLNK